MRLSLRSAIVRPTGFLLRKAAFHSSGKPRGWVRALLFRKRRHARPLARAIVYKKNGNVRRHFSSWLSVEEPGAGWSGSHSIPPAWTALRPPRSLEQSVQEALSAPAPPSELSREEVARHLAASLARTSDRLLLTVSHDDYTKRIGGVEICIGREQRSTLSAGGSYLNVHPWYPIRRLARPTDQDDALVGLVLDGVCIGSCRMSSLLAAVRTAAATREIEVAVHHLMGHAPEQIAELVLATGSRNCILWLHDFFLLCPSYALQRNDLAFCGAPPETSNACTVCLYGAERRDHARRMADFFRTVAVHLISPSTVALDYWRRRSDLPVASTGVAPLMRLAWVKRDRSLVDLPTADLRTADLPTAGAPVVVAFLGNPAIHKGWPVFERLYGALQSQPDYRFLVLGAVRPADCAIECIDVRVTIEAPAAMSDAVAAAKVDIVIHWSNWPETFSLTTHEALAGGAFVVTNHGSGNVAATVERTARGAVLDDEAALVAFFRGGRAVELARSSREARAAFDCEPRLEDEVPRLSAAVN